MAQSRHHSGPVNRVSAKRTNRASERPISERRQALMGIAAGLLAQQGYRATTVREIAEAGGVLSGSLYHHFESKEAIVEELLSSYLDELLLAYRRIKEQGLSPRETLVAFTRAAVQSVADHRAAVTVFRNERSYLSQFPRFVYLADREAEIESLWVGVIEQGMKDGSFRQDLSTDLIYRFVRDVVSGSASWFRPDGCLTVSQLTVQYLAIIMDGIANPDRSSAVG